MLVNSLFNPNFKNLTGYEGVSNFGKYNISFNFDFDKNLIISSPLPNITLSAKDVEDFLQIIQKINHDINKKYEDEEDISKRLEYVYKCIVERKNSDILFIIYRNELGEYILKIMSLSVSDSYVEPFLCKRIWDECLFRFNFSDDAEKVKETLSKLIAENMVNHNINDGTYKPLLEYIKNHMIFDKAIEL